MAAAAASLCCQGLALILGDAGAGCRRAGQWQWRGNGVGRGINGLR